MDLPVAKAGMLIRASAHDAFEAFRDPQRITAFWLDHASGPLAPDARVDWRFMVPGATDTVRVAAFEPDRLIALDSDAGTSIELRFQPQGKDAVIVRASERGFAGTDAWEQAIGATEGFAIVLCDLKSLLETGTSGGMVRDKAALIAEAGKPDASK